jgi:hypothetical protein
VVQGGQQYVLLGVNGSTAMSQSVQAGDTVFAVTATVPGTSQTAPIPTLTTSSADTWSQVSTVESSSGNIRATLYKMPVATGGTYNFTATSPGSATAGMQLAWTTFVCRGAAATASIVDISTTTAIGANISTLTLAGGPTTQANEVAIGIVAQRGYNSVTQTAPGTWLQLASVQSAAGSNACNLFVAGLSLSSTQVISQAFPWQVNTGNAGAAGILVTLKSVATPTPTPGPTPTPTPTPTASPSGTTITTAGPTLIDSNLASWSIRSDGGINKNGGPATNPDYSANVVLMLYYNGVIYHQNSTNYWYKWVVQTSQTDPANWVALGLGADPRNPAPAPTPTPTTAYTAQRIIDCMVLPNSPSGWYPAWGPINYNPGQDPNQQNNQWGSE